MARKKEEKVSRTPSKREKKFKSDTSNDETQQFATFNNQLAVMGLALREVPGDGNCLFRALGDQLEGHTKNHLKHRQETVEYMKKNRSDFEPFVEDNVSFERYIGNLEKSGSYAGNDAIVAFARKHGVTVVIHQLNSPLWKVHGGDSKKPGRELHIAYHNGDHYNSVRSLGDNSESPANIQVEISKKTKSTRKEVNGLSKAYPDYYKDSGDFTDINETDLVQLIMERTGCQDRSLVEESLEDNGFDVESTVDYVIHVMVISEHSSYTHEDELEETSSKCELGIWSPEGTGTRIFGNHLVEESSSQNDRKDIGGARQKSPRQKIEPKKHISNRQRKEMKRQERKQNSEMRKKSSMNSYTLSDEDTYDEMSDSVVEQLGCLNI